MQQLTFDNLIPPKFIPSKYQEAIFDFIQNGTGHCIVNAVAGSGKTETIIRSLKYISKDKKIVFCAFNKHIADKLKEKVPENVWATTLHGAGYRVMMMNKFKPEVDIYKQSTIFQQILRTDLAKLYELTRGTFNKEIVEDDYFYSVRDAVNMMKASMLPETTESLKYITEFYDIDTCDNYQLFEYLVFRSMELALRKTNRIDFYDMIWIPLKLKLYIPQYDFVFIDELQDLNNMQIEFALKLCKPVGRMIMLGDEFQSLYGFLGASTEAMSHTIKRISGISLPLSVSYRCPVSHVVKAKEYVDAIESAPNAKQGHIEHINDLKFLDLIKPGDMVICRNNAPLIDYAFAALDKGYKINIRGKDIGHGLMTIVKKCNVKTVTELKIKLEAWKEREINKALSENKNPERVEDKYKALISLCSKTKTTLELIDYIRKLFSDENKEIVFSTIHRAKGLEADRVFIIKFNLIPNKWARQDWELAQERNCAYVGVTRSKNELYFVS